MIQGNLLCFTYFGQEFATSVFLRFPVHNISSSGIFSGTFESQNSQQWRKLLVLKNIGLNCPIIYHLPCEKQVQKEYRESVGEI